MKTVQTLFDYNTGMKTALLAIVLSLPVITAAETLHMLGGNTVTLTPMPSAKTDGMRHYRMPNGRAVAFGPELLVKVTDEANISALARDAGVLHLERLSRRLYLFRLDDRVDPLVLAKHLRERTDVRFAHPNFRAEKQLR